MDYEQNYDAYDLDERGPSEIYVNQLNLVLAGERVFLVDETNASDIAEDVRGFAPDGELVIWQLDRSSAAPFARYMSWDATCAAFPADHPIHHMRIPAMRAMELDGSDPRLEQFDFAAIRIAFSAATDQARSRMKTSPYHTPSLDMAPEEMPRID